MDHTLIEEDEAVDRHVTEGAPVLGPQAPDALYFAFRGVDVFFSRDAESPQCPRRRGVAHAQAGLFRVGVDRLRKRRIGHLFGQGSNHRVIIDAAATAAAKRARSQPSSLLLEANPATKDAETTPKRAARPRNALAGALLSSLPASAPPKGPPPAAITACAGKTPGDACALEGRRDAVEGLCQSPEVTPPGPGPAGSASGLAASLLSRGGNSSGGSAGRGHGRSPDGSWRRGA